MHMASRLHVVVVTHPGMLGASSDLVLTVLCRGNGNGNVNGNNNFGSGNGNQNGNNNLGSGNGNRNGNNNYGKSQSFWGVLPWKSCMPC